VDEVMSLFGSEGYYDKPRVHVSVASMKGDVTTTVKEDNWGGNKILGGRVENERIGYDNDTSDDDTLYTSTIRLDKIYCTFGTTKTYSIELTK
jgi:hypothetical protein